MTPYLRSFPIVLQPTSKLLSPLHSSFSTVRRLLLLWVSVLIGRQTRSTRLAASLVQPELLFLLLVPVPQHFSYILKRISTFFFSLMLSCY